MPDLGPLINLIFIVLVVLSIILGRDRVRAETMRRQQRPVRPPWEPAELETEGSPPASAPRRLNPPRPPPPPPKAPPPPPRSASARLGELPKLASLAGPGAGPKGGGPSEGGPLPAGARATRFGGRRTAPGFRVAAGTSRSAALFQGRKDLRRAVLAHEILGPCAALRPRGTEER